MTPPRLPGLANAVRSPFLLLLLPVAVILAIPALTPTESMFPSQGDVDLYLRYAREIAHGSIPYSEVQVEYPPLAMLPMLVPYLAGLPFGEPTVDTYKWLFAAWEAILLLTLGFVLIRIARLGGLATAPATARDPGWVVASRLPILVIGAALAIAWRFDLFAALLLAIAVWAALANRPVAAGIALGLGVLTKLYPLAAGPAIALLWLAPRDDGRVIKFGLATALTIALGVLPFAALAGTETFVFLAYQSLRGLQIESIGGGLVLLGGLVSGVPVETDAPFKAIEVMRPQARLFLAVLPVVAIVGFTALTWLGWRRTRAEFEATGSVRPSTIVTLAGAAVMVLLDTSKVFSIQYVVWLVPFAALLPGRKFWLAAAIVALTIPIHPLLYEQLIEQEAMPVLILNLRNGLLVALTVWVIAGLRGGRRELARPAGLEPTTFRSAT